MSSIMGAIRIWRSGNCRWWQVPGWAFAISGYCAGWRKWERDEIARLRDELREQTHWADEHFAMCRRLMTAMLGHPPEDVTRESEAKAVAAVERLRQTPTTPTTGGEHG